MLPIKPKLKTINIEREANLQLRWFCSYRYQKFVCARTTVSATCDTFAVISMTKYGTRKVHLRYKLVTFWLTVITRQDGLFIHVLNCV